MRKALAGSRADDRLRAQPASRPEIRGLLVKVERRLRTAERSALVREDPDTAFEAAYGAGLLLCHAVVRASGYRLPRGGAHHKETIAVAGQMMGTSALRFTRLLQTARGQRHAIWYGSYASPSPQRIAELVTETRGFLAKVRNWLTQRHPEVT